MGAYSIWEIPYIFSPEGGAHLYFSSQVGVHVRRGCIIEALQCNNSDTMLYSDILFITFLDTIVISSDDEIHDYRS